MRISDWSSGVCSSDLHRRMHSTVPLPPRSALARWLPRVLLPWLLLLAAPGCTPTAKALDSSELAFEGQNYRIVHVNLKRQQMSSSEESRVGKGCVSTCRSRRAPIH